MHKDSKYVSTRKSNLGQLKGLWIWKGFGNNHHDQAVPISVVMKIPDLQEFKDKVKSRYILSSVFTNSLYIILPTINSGVLVLVHTMTS